MIIVKFSLKEEPNTDRSLENKWNIIVFRSFQQTFTLSLSLCECLLYMGQALGIGGEALVHCTA